MAQAFKHYLICGLEVKSDLPVPCATTLKTHKPDLEFKNSKSSLKPTSLLIKTEEQKNWLVYRDLKDGSTYLRWRSHFEFIVDPLGQRVSYHRLQLGSLPSLQTYLMGQALSVALIKKGIEPLHATAIKVGREAVAFLGDSGMGKSTLAAFFIREGHRLLTDDLLILKKTKTHLLAVPAFARIKLFPTEALGVLKTKSLGVPMNDFNEKRIYTLSAKQFCTKSAPLKKIYILNPKKNSSSISIKTLNQKDAVLALIENTYNGKTKPSNRLAQQLKTYSTWLKCLQVKVLSYPKMKNRLGDVREAILKDVKP